MCSPVRQAQQKVASSAPITSLQAALFQWVNPKAWAMAMTAVTVYARSQSLAAVGLVALVTGLVDLPPCFVWVVMGQKLRRFLGSDPRLRIFNALMAILLLLSLYPMLFD